VSFLRRPSRLTPLGNMITVVAVSIGAGVALVIYVYVVGISGDREVKGDILVGGIIGLLLATGVGVYFAQLAARRISRIQEAARKVADGDFTTRIPVDSGGQLGQLARSFNEMQSRLDELDSARKQFIANASHELRTPIFSLGGFVELLEDEDPDPEARDEFVHAMREQVERLTKLTGDLLDLSQMDAGGMAARRRRVDLGEIAREIVREFGPRASSRDSRLELRTPDRAAVAETDPDWIRRILRILLDNALTHTAEGTKVTVTSYNSGERAELTVSDEGPGIQRRSQARIFERFYTEDSVSGSGLGLAIARELSQRMGGRLTVTSSKGFTAFTLDLPGVALTPQVPAGDGAAA